MPRSDASAKLHHKQSHTHTLSLSLSRCNKRRSRLWPSRFSAPPSFLHGRICHCSGLSLISSSLLSSLLSSSSPNTPPTPQTRDIVTGPARRLCVLCLLPAQLGARGDPSFLCYSVPVPKIALAPRKGCSAIPPAASSAAPPPNITTNKSQAPGSYYCCWRASRRATDITGELLLRK